MEPKSLLGSIFIIWLNLSSIIVWQDPTTMLSKPINAILLPYQIILYTAIFTIFTSGLSVIIGFIGLFAFIYYCTPIRQKNYGKIFLFSVITSVAIAFYTTFNGMLSLSFNRVSNTRIAFSFFSLISMVFGIYATYKIEKNIKLTT